MQTKQQKITAFVQGLFPGQFLIPVPAFARLICESAGGCRNRKSEGTLDIRVMARGSRNFVGIIDVIDYLVKLDDDGEDQPAPVAPAEEQEEKTGRRSKYGEAAKTRAAVARAARAIQRQARASAPKSEVAK